MNLLKATSINMIDMAGIGPFVVMPFVMPHFKYVIPDLQSGLCRFKPFGLYSSEK